MAIIPLRQYNREIEGLIDTGQLDEAVAHCRQILETFPKHIATYRLLGKAYMEQQRYSDATDIFQRVLSSVPDDHVANIGLSIIREDEGNLDAAIWYMERALEAQPSNSAIKDELRRLYGRRDGIEPPKIRLTRGALARMYSRGGLYDQAIAELRAALADDPQRPDLMVMLAQVFFYLGQQVEAVDICGTIMKQLPYCLVANRILASILPQTGRADDTKTYYQRAVAMDPYFSSAPPQALSTDSVPEMAIKIERLEYRPGQQAGGPAQPAWAASLGIAFEENQQDKLPEWMQDQEDLEEISKPEARSIPTEPFSWETKEDEIRPLEEPTKVEDIIPEWMKEAGWQPATGETTEEQMLADLEFPSEEQEDEIAKAEIPDWLQDLAPSGALDEEPSSDQGEMELPWLQKTTPGASDTIVNWLGSNKQPSELEEESESVIEPPAETQDKTPQPDPVARGENGELPDWLQGVEATYGKSGITDWLKSSRLEEYEAAPALEKHPPDEAAQPEEEIPEWPEEVDEAALPTEEIPDWLKEMGEISPRPELTEYPPEEIDLPTEELPDWLKDMGEGKPEPTFPEPDADASPLPTEELPDWLIAMGEAEPESEIFKPTAEEIVPPTEDLPDWVEEIIEEGAESILVEPTKEDVSLHTDSYEPSSEEPALPDEELPDWLKDTGQLQPPEADTPPAEDDADKESALADIDIPDWLQDFGQPESTGVEASPIQQTTEEEATPTDIVPSLPEDTVEVTLPAVEAEDSVKPTSLKGSPEDASPAEETPEWLLELEQPPVEAAEPFGEQAGQDTALAWLESLAAKHSPQEEKLSTKSEEPQDEISSWDSVDETELPAAQIPAQPTAMETAQPIEQLPDWLKEIEDTPTDLPAEESSPESALPFIDQAEQDAALAWLEKLAAQHGAKEEELITQPEERLEAIPDWIKLAADEAQHDEELHEQTTDQEEPASHAEELPKWIKEMAEIEVAGAPSETTEEESILSPDESVEPSEELPEWLQEMTEPAKMVPPVELVVDETILPVEESAPSLEELPEWLREHAEPTEVDATGEPAIQTTETPKDVTDADAALAWLEGLAAQHGAKEEELITKPEERLETMPDWITQEAVIEEETAEIPTQPVPVVHPDLSQATIDLPGGQVDDQPELIEERLKTELERAVSEESPPPSDELPDWLSETSGTGDAQTLPEAHADLEQLTDWLKETTTPQQEMTGEEPDSDLDKLPDWLREPDQVTEEEAERLPSSELTAAPAWMPGVILPEAELPTAPSPPLKAPPALEEIEEEISEQEPESITSELTPETININTAPLSQLENLTGIGFVLGQRIIEYRETNGPFAEIDDLTNVSGIGPVVIENLREWLTTGIPVKTDEEIPEAETEDWLFSKARKAVEKGDVDHASTLYNQLISQGANREQVIGEMQEALYRYPLDINLWQTLGDAYLRTDKLQEALDAYTKAEELLR